ncbi:MAG: recombination regulator RecX [Butyrivibrio sp.]|nr:recombination regulator RecX [Butyrivibrio sp.]
MIITAVEALDKKRFKVYIDGEFAFVLYRGELKDYGISPGQEIGEAVVSEITDVLLLKRAKLRAMNLLQKKDYTRKQLTDKLKEGLYPTECIEGAISYVESYHYLDDKRFATDYITYHMQSRSKNRIIRDLMDKGIGKDLLMPLIDEIYSEESGEDVELEQVKTLLVKKHYDPENCDFKEKQKIMAFLLRRGYSMETVRRAMED